MCGIVGYVGDRKTTEILLEGLNKLEYRGYDSSGIAIKSQDNIQIIKSEGKISDLEKKVENSSLIESKLGIAHTRWATHGEANETNAHPHQFGKQLLSKRSNRSNNQGNGTSKWIIRIWHYF